MSIITLSQNAQTLVKKQVKKVNPIQWLNSYFDLEDAELNDYVWFYGVIGLAVFFGALFLVFKIVAEVM